MEGDELVYYSTKVSRLVSGSTIRIMVGVMIVVGIMMIMIGQALKKFDLILFKTDQEL